MTEERQEERQLTEEEKCGHSPLYWVIKKQLVNENQKPFEFIQHRFIRDLYSDWSPNIVLKKSAQLGLSTWAILRAIHWAAYRGANIAVTSPNRNIGTEFLIPKWDPIVAHNPFVKGLMSGTNTPSLKKVGNRYIYFRGTHSDTEAISISVDGLINDESDRSDNAVLRTYESRLDHADPALRFHWMLSNPSTPEVGVDYYYRKSTQHTWLVTCRSGHEMELKYPESLDKERECYQCSRCHVELTDRDRIMGRWEAKSPGQTWKGYHLSQLAAPWIPASKVIQDSEEKPLDTFYNFTLGEAYAPQDAKMTRSMFIERLSPGHPEEETRYVLGVDNGVVKHWVLMSKLGVKDFGKTEDWGEIERVFRLNNCSVMVVDALPYPATPQQLARKYRGRVWLHYSTQDKRSEGMIRWGKRKKGYVVETDRTKIIDYIVLKLSGEVVHPYLFFKTDRQMEEFISHCTIMYRINEETNYGLRGKWITPEGRDDHYFFAWMHAIVALEKISAGAVVTPRERPIDAVGMKYTPYVDVDQIAKESLKATKSGLQR